MSSLRLDLQYAIRSLLKNPAVTLVAVLSLALGLGATTTIFSAVDVFMIRPLSFADSDELVYILSVDQRRGGAFIGTSVPNFVDWRAASRTLDLASYETTGLNFSGGERPERLQALRVSTNLLPLLQVEPVLGRGFLPQEEKPGGDRVVLLSDALWHRSFAASRDLLGQAVYLDGVAHTVIGILPEGFRFDEGYADVLVPIQVTGDEPRGQGYQPVVGRLREGATPEQARAEMEEIARRLREAYPEANADMGVRVLRLQEWWFDEEFRQASLVLSAAVLLVLLIACANVANLLLSRAVARGREIALRGALGADRRRIVRQLLTESVVLAAVGGFVGVLLSIYGIHWFVSLLPAGWPEIENIGLNTRVLGFTAAAVLLCGVGFGLVPALKSAHGSLSQTLREGGRGGTGGRSGRLRKALVVAEISLAVVLLVSAFLLIQAFLRLRDTDLGFDTEPVLTMQLALPETRYPSEEQVRQFQQQVVESLAGLPGIEAAGATSHVPTRGALRRTYTIPGEEPVDPDQQPTVFVKLITPGYLESMGIERVAGRGIEWSDRAGGSRVALVNQALAEHHWAGSDPLGQWIDLGDGPQQIVGVVETARLFGPENEPPRMVYVPLLQAARRQVSLAVRTRGDPRAFIDTLRNEVLRLDSEQPVYEVATMAEILRSWLGGPIAMMQILTVLASIALFLAVIGVYGVMSYSVAQRTREVGIRMALGARRRDVLAHVLRQGTLLTLTGVAIGVALGLAVTRLLAFFLYGVSPFDPLTFSAVAVVLLLVGVVATYLPARRATVIHPMVVLRED